MPELLDVYESEDYLHLVMPKIFGFDFMFWMKSKVKYSEKDAQAIAQELLKIVVPFHNNQFIHRDIRPDNIVVL